MAPNTESIKKDAGHYLEVQNDKAATKPKQGQHLNGSFVLDLGNYRAAKLPISILLVISVMLYCSVINTKPHPLSEGRLLLDNMTLMFSLMYGYILFCTVWGPNMMKNRDPIKLKTVIKYYNIFQVLICSYMVYEFGVSGWFGKYNFYCEPLKYTTEPNEVRMASIVYIYYLTKILDLLDTVFFILNKKWDHVSLLHLVHHSTMVLNLWFACLYIPRGHITFSMFINSFIHIVMYGYYYLASLGPAVRPFLWWKKYLTVLQIIQLVSIFLHATQVIFNGCNVNMGLTSVSVLCSLIYIVLFLDFYVSSYREKTKSKASTNGIDDAYIATPLYVRQRKQNNDEISTESKSL